MTGHYPETSTNLSGCAPVKEVLASLARQDALRHVLAADAGLWRQHCAVEVGEEEGPEDDDDAAG
jgi:hypothetical protein